VLPNNHSALDQPWVEFQGFLHQSKSIHPLVYCEVEEEFRYKESDDHPKNMGQDAAFEREAFEREAFEREAFDGYVEVDSVPHKNDKSTEADYNDPKRAPLVRFSHPQIRGVAGSGAISGWNLHLFCASVYIIGSAKIM